MSDLNSDVSPERARALHRVVRAMHDGNCPSCGDGSLIQPSHTDIEDIRDVDGNKLSKRCYCPKCLETLIQISHDGNTRAFCTECRSYYIVQTFYKVLEDYEWNQALLRTDSHEEGRSNRPTQVQ